MPNDTMTMSMLRVELKLLSDGKVDIADTDVPDKEKRYGTTQSG